MEFLFEFGIEVFVVNRSVGDGDEVKIFLCDVLVNRGVLEFGDVFPWCLVE